MQQFVFRGGGGGVIHSLKKNYSGEFIQGWVRLGELGTLSHFSDFGLWELY